MISASCEDSDEPGHPPSLIRVFAVRMKKPSVLSYSLSAQRRIWSDWADAQACLSLRWRTFFCWFCRLPAQYRDFLPPGFLDKNVIPNDGHLLDICNHILETQQLLLRNKHTTRTVLSDRLKALTISSNVSKSSNDEQNY